MPDLFRPSDDGDGGELDVLLDRSAQPTRRTVLDVPGGMPPRLVAQLAEEMLAREATGHVDLWVDGRPAGVVSVSSLRPVILTSRGEARGYDLGGRPARREQVPTRRERLRCAACEAVVVRLAGPPRTRLRCPAGHDALRPG